MGLVKTAIAQSDQCLFFQAEDGMRDYKVTGVQTCALPIYARVQSRSQQEIVATLGIRRGALHGEFTTRNTLEPERSIRMQLVSGPFRTLQGEWRLLPIESNGCRVELTMRFAFRNPLTALLFDSQFAAIIGSLPDAFVARARARP